MSQDLRETVTPFINCLRCIVLNSLPPKLMKFECNSTWCRKFCGAANGVEEEKTSLPRY